MTNNVNQPSQIDSDVMYSWLKTLLGTPDSTPAELREMFGEKSINLSAILAPQSPLPESVVKVANPKEPAGEDGSKSPQTPVVPNNDLVVLKFSFTTLPGYTWPTNLTTPSELKNAKNTPDNYKLALSNSNQTLDIYVKTQLKPGFALAPQGQSQITIDSSQNTLTATVNASGTVNDYKWYAYTPEGKSIEISQSNITEVQKLFGAGVTIDIQNGHQTSTLKLTNITVVKNY